MVTPGHSSWEWICSDKPCLLLPVVVQFILECSSINRTLDMARGEMRPFVGKHQTKAWILETMSAVIHIYLR